LHEDCGNESDQHDGNPAGDVDDEVVRRRDDRDRHGERREHGERPNGEVGRRAEEDDSDQDVPAGVQARESRVLVRKARRLQCAVRAGLVGDGVEKPEVEQTRRRDREEREEEEADRTGDEHRVAKQPVAVAPEQEEGDAGREDHRPVTPDVDPVRERDQRLAARDGRLDALFLEEPECPLQAHDPVGVLERRPRAARRHVANCEVRCHRGDDQCGLPGHAPQPVSRHLAGASASPQIDSGTISIAPDGHSAAQIPQPLQKS
jgi:hypothetical protein